MAEIDQSRLREIVRHLGGDLHDQIQDGQILDALLSIALLLENAHLRIEKLEDQIR